MFLTITVTAQTPPAPAPIAPPTDKKADPKRPEKAEQEPRPVEQELQKQQAQSKDAPAPQPPAESPVDAKDSALSAAGLPVSDSAKKDEKPKWNVSEPPGPKSDVNIDVRNGTWLSLDVSPDGKEIVFDLLGDLYTMPIGGGEAKALTSGIEWDMHPRYSPNGRWIAFTSDRAGGDNIWYVNRDGSNPKQVTKETFRLVTQPAWSPDSEYIVARKHFTSERSLGAGEMWIYHRSGGGGLQLTKRPNDQKDAGEPVFSTDGRYVYFSQDTTPGKVFEYNKDPNKQIYVIQRYDRESGELEAFVTGPGGSIRPTPSPDGKSLAFIRRVRGKSVLYVMDLDSGRETPLYDRLERDMQETWAIHGVYPSMAWTPDNRSIVFWAAGTFHRIDVASKSVSDIAFHATGKRTIQEAVRFPIEVAPKEFAVKMIRWPRVSPNGKQVVYSAMGQLYLRDLPNGAPRRLTKQSDHFEYYPAWSRDGKSIAYVTWNDETQGAIRIASATTGESRVITDKPGHYIEPAFSPDGGKLAYRVVSDGFLVPSTGASRQTGIYIVPTAGGKPMRVTKDGVTPHFGASNDRLYFTTYEDEDKRSLRSISLRAGDLDGRDERTHLTSDAAVEMYVSPNGKWIAWNERFNAFVAPFVATGKNVDIAPDMKSLPMAKVSKDSGDFIDWSGDSSQLHWSVGPELFSRDLKDAFSFLDGAPEKPGDGPEKGINIGMNVPYDVPSGRLAFTGARIVTMRGDEVIENGTVVVNGNRIEQLGAASSVTIPAGAKVIDAAGKTIIPGLVDVHWHGGMGANEIIPQQNWIHYAALGFGVTTIHDPSNNTTEVFTAAEMARRGMITAPRIFSTGTILYGAKGSFKAEVDSLDDALSHLRRMKAVGAYSVKSYNQPRRDQRQQIIEAARQTQMMVVPEGGSLFEHNMSMVVDGHTGVEHSIPVEKIYDDVRQLWGKSKTGYTPTLIVGYGGNWGENYWYQKTNVWEDARLSTFVPRRILDSRSRRRVMVPEDEHNHFRNAAVTNELLKSGVNVQLGAHGQREGLGAHWELWMFVHGGMTPLQALRAGTLAGARYLGMDHDIGSLEPGKLADFAVLDANPLTDIRNSESVHYTVVNGRVYDAATMNEVGNHPRTRGKFFFEMPGMETWGAAATAASAHDQD